MKKILKKMIQETKDFFIQNKYIFKLILVLLIFLFSDLFEKIPILLFNINTKEITPNIALGLNIFSKTLTLFIFLTLYRKELIKNFKDFWKNKIDYLDIGIKYWFIGLIIMASSNYLISIFTPSNMSNNETAVRTLINIFPIFYGLSVAVFSPIIEELVFRKAFREAFTNNILFIIISGLIFGGLHVILQSPSLYDYLYLIPYCGLGFCMAYMYVKTNNIWTSIFIHIIHNSIMTISTIVTSGVILLW